MTRMRAIFALVAIMLVALPGIASAELVYEIRGVDDPLEANILNYLDTLQLGPQTRLADRNFDSVLARSIRDAKIALRPYGYYAAEVDGHIRRESKDEVVVQLIIERGPAIIIEYLHLEISGAGSASGILRDWKKRWPLKEGKVLNQVTWEEQKQRAIELTDSNGYLSAEFTTHVLEIDLERNRATLKLALDTGRRFVMGDIDFGEHVLNPGILEFVPRFENGDPYTAHLMERFRRDLWTTGYFTDVDVFETKVPDAEPPRVDLRVRTRTDYRNRYTGAVGFGNDTGVRLQANWLRQPMSARGDQIDIGIGWQELDDQISARATYRIPRAARNREFWTVDTVLRYESVDLEFKLHPEDDDYVKLANGRVDERHLRLGRLKIRNFLGGETQVFETPFVQLVHSEERFEPLVPSMPLSAGDDVDQLLRRIDTAFSLGIEYGLVNVLGKGFDIRGHRERAWIFHSDTALGSEIDFTQVYLSTVNSRRLGERWKFIFRAEVGYTDAAVKEFSIDIGGIELDISNSELPSFYRFKAGGSHSVRGYAFESLSNNDIGSNNIITASVELEARVSEKWSAAVFVDTGNAFNDWTSPELKTGVGVGIRWYSIAGPIRIDFAQALDYRNDPWRVHFTFGVPLL